MIFVLVRSERRVIRSVLSIKELDGTEDTEYNHGTGEYDIYETAPQIIRAFYSFFDAYVDLRRFPGSHIERRP